MATFDEQVQQLRKRIDSAIAAEGPYGAWRDICHLVLDDIRDLQHTDLMSGGSGYSHSQLMRDLDVFLCVCEEKIPEQWNKYKQQVDPEYQEYLRLKAKFEK